MKKAIVSLALVLVGCISVDDYSGAREMTYQLTLEPSGPAPARTLGGSTRVEIHEGPGGDLLIDLGPSLCRLRGVYVPALYVEDDDHVDIEAQRCYAVDGDDLVELTLSGSGNFEGEDYFVLALTGTFADGEERGSARLQLAETW
jgi:hypothetical protein